MLAQRSGKSFAQVYLSIVHEIMNNPGSSLLMTSFFDIITLHVCGSTIS